MASNWLEIFGVIFAKLTPANNTIGKASYDSL